MTKKSNNTALVVTGAQDVPSVLQLLEKEISSLKHITDTVYKTRGSLEGFGDIKTEMKVENLIRVFSMVMGKSKAYAESAKELGLNTFPVFSISGGDVEAWKHDCTLRINIINHKDKLDKLNDYKTRMSTFLSQQDQKAMLLDEMANFLGTNSGE